MDNYEDNLHTLIGKVEGSVDMDWSEICDYIGADVHPDSLRKAFSVTDYCGYQVAKYLMNKTAHELTSDMIKALQDKRNEEYKERVRLQDARREYNKELRAEARFENLVEIMREQLDTVDDEVRFGERHHRITEKKPKVAILSLCDWHYGAICDSQWNYYNVEIAQQRAEQIINKTIMYILSMGITDIIVEIGGDMVDGDINVGSRVSQEESVIEQVINVSKLLSKCIMSLKPYVHSIKVVTTLGNHGRLTARKKEQADEKENFELLIPEFLRLTLDSDIKIITSQGLDFVKYNVGDKVICLTHGHHDRINSVIENMVKVYKVVPNEIHLGHYHHLTDINDSDIYITVCGSLKGIDNYGLGATRSTTKPSQNLIIYDADRILIELTAD